MARQGVAMPTLAALQVGDAESGAAVPRDGTTLGEVMVRGNTVMKGYLGNAAATAQAFAGGWFHTGDLAVWHPDQTIEVKDRAKDIIISGGENISSLEVEECLYRHPAVMEAAVVARPDAEWGETPCAFVALQAGRRGRCSGPHRMVPGASRTLQGAALDRVRAAAEDLDRQDPEVHAARNGAGDDGQRCRRRFDADARRPHGARHGRVERARTPFHRHAGRARRNGDRRRTPRRRARCDDRCLAGRRCGRARGAARRARSRRRSTPRCATAVRSTSWSTTRASPTWRPLRAWRRRLAGGDRHQPLRRVSRRGGGGACDERREATGA